MLIRRNTKAFKSILEIFLACRDRPDREKLIRLYITKAGDTIKERISIEGIEGQAQLFYEMNYQGVLGNLKSSNYQLHHSDEIPGIYFFHSSSNKVWDETPFEFDEAVKDEFRSLAELPVLRKKDRVEKFVFPGPNPETERKPPTNGKAERKKEKSETKKAAKVVALWPKQPDYRLKRDIQFSGLERVVFREAGLTKRNVLDYYNQIAEHLLPYLKDRPQQIRLQADGQADEASMNLTSLVQSSREEIPDWIETATVGKGKEQLLLCNDKEHLLFYVQVGCVEFNACHSRVPPKSSAKGQIKSLDFPDYLLLVIESPGYELGNAIGVALAAKEILSGLGLPSFVKTDGTSGLHIHIPLDSKSRFEASRQVAEYLCRLVRLKIPDLVTLKGPEGHLYGKVSLEYLINDLQKAVVAPYSLVAGQSPNVATPLMWEEVNEGLKAEAFNYETIFERLKAQGDPFRLVFKKGVNADSLLKKIEENYSFLF